MIGRQPGRLIESEIIRNLSTPSELKDTGWIKPGMMAWDHWWTGDTVMDTATIKEYIQLAADMGWPYQLIDWGWYGEPNKPEADITKVVDSLDMEEVRRFAEEKGVRLWLWLHWTDVDRNDAYKKAFPLYREWGIAGVKIDFMDRDDQEMVRWYEKITRAAAEHQLMVNFHGAYKPTGFDRTFPNQLTREGVLGNEYNKWSARVTPEHKVTLPFTRYLVGPGDFTPGGFLNRQPGRVSIAEADAGAGHARGGAGIVRRLRQPALLRLRSSGPLPRPARRRFPEDRAHRVGRHARARRRRGRASGDGPAIGRRMVSRCADQ